MDLWQSILKSILDCILKLCLIPINHRNPLERPGEYFDKPWSLSKINSFTLLSGFLFILSGKSFHVRFRVNESLLLHHQQFQQLQLRPATVKLHNATYTQGKRRFPSRIIYNKVNRKLDKAALLILQGIVEKKLT